MRKPDYSEWKHVLIDTSVLFAYQQATRSNNSDQRCVFVKRLVDDLVNRKSQLYMSAISISEMYNKSDDTPKTKKIIEHLNCKNMTFVSFDTPIAEHMTSHYYKILGKDKISELVQEISWPSSDLFLAKEWITKDLMIIATADYINADVLLTLDRKTMHPLAKKVDVFSSYVIQENFNQNQAYIFYYEESES
jgi:predicted nucleic acid-binding protein